MLRSILKGDNFRKIIYELFVKEFVRFQTLVVRCWTAESSCPHNICVLDGFWA